MGTQPTKHGYITNNEDVTIAEDELAEVVLKGQLTNGQPLFDADEYDARLIIRNGIRIPAGADIHVTGVSGQMAKYKCTSKGYSGYSSHQEVVMVKSEKA